MNSFEFVFDRTDAAANADVGPILEHQRVVTVVREPGQTGSFAAHLGFAAKNTGLRVLLVDLARDGLLTRSVRLSRPISSSVSLSASQLFNRACGLDPERLIPGLSLVKADGQLIDASMNVDAAASRLYRTLGSLRCTFDLCVIEVPDNMSVESLAAMQIASNVMTTACHAVSKPRQMAERAEQLATLISCSSAFGRMADLTVLPLAKAIASELGDAEMSALAERTVLASIDFALLCRGDDLLHTASAN
jgi:hypothetical protein